MSVEKIAHVIQPLNLVKRRSGMKKLALILILLIVATPLAISQWQFVKAFPDTSFKLPAGVNNGIAVDPEGKVWIQSYSSSNDSLAPGVKTGAIYVFYPNGTPAPFSPIKTLSAGGITDTLNGAGYGMRTDYQGNILSVKWSTRVWRINYKTGQGMNRVWNPISGYTSSLTTVADDSLGEVFVAPVLPGGAVAVLNPDFSPAGNVASSVDGYGRDILVSKNGNDVYVPRFSLRKVYVYHSDNGSLGPYVLQDSILTQFVVETMAWDPKTGWMWVGSGNTTSGLPDPPYSPYAWYAYDLATKTIVDSIKWVGDVTKDPRPRGIAFSPTGDTVYVAAFNISDVTPVEMFVRRPTGVREPGGLPAAYELSQNYPNPFNPSTKIDFALRNSGKVTLRVYDVLGREVATLVDGYKPAGHHSVTFNAGNLPSGVYIYTLDAPEGTHLTKKMILMK